MTQDEHAQLTPFDKKLDGWARYAAANIGILDMSTGEPLNTAD